MDGGTHGAGASPTPSWAWPPASVGEPTIPDRCPRRPRARQRACSGVSGPVWACEHVTQHQRGTAREAKGSVMPQRGLPTHLRCPSGRTRNAGAGVLWALSGVCHVHVQRWRLQRSAGARPGQGPPAAHHTGRRGGGARAARAAGSVHCGCLSRWAQRKRCDQVIWPAAHTAGNR